MRFSILYITILGVSVGYSLSVYSEETMVITNSSEYATKFMDNSEKFSDPIKDTPRTIVVVPRKIIEDTNANTLTEALKYVPGISFKSGDALAKPGGDHPTLRGFDATDSITIDSVRNTASQSRESFDIENIEVIKGPSAIYNGRGNAGGSVNIVTKKPFSGRSVTRTAIGLGTYNYKRATVDSNQQLSEHIAARINLMWHENDKPKRSMVDYSRWGMAPSILFSNESTSLLLSYYHLYSNDMPDYSTPFDKTGSPLNKSTGLFYGMKNRDYILNRVDTPEAVLSHEFENGLTVKNTTVYSKTVQQFIATSPSLSKIKSEPDLMFLQAKSGDFRTTTFSNLTDLTQQVWLASMLHKFSAGVEYTREDNKRKSMWIDVRDPTSGDMFNIRSQPKGFNCATQGIPTYTCTPVNHWNPYNPWVGHKSWAQETAYPATHTINNTVSGYIFDSISLTDNLIFSLGGRYDHYDTKFNTIETSPKEIDSRKGLFNYQIGILWSPVNEISLYSSWSTSSNPANSDTIQGGISDKRKNGFTPEEFTNLEVGTKWAPLDEKFILTLSAFDARQKNGHFSVEPNYSLPIGEQEVKGLEVSAEGSITDNWSIFGGYSRLNAKITKSAQLAEQGKKMPLTPEESATLWTKYNLTKDLSAGAGIVYTGKTYANTKNTASVPRYTVFNSMLRYQANKNTTLQININNMFNKTYYDTLYPNFATFGPGRQIIGNIEYKF
ncbi:TonB-dependent siderophore receptor [Salmonella enterica subsp. enterica]|nr:TonB-dependent siderophore receptor [Salmonella enterica subsp. enterica serovar Abaetetuba]